MKEDSLSKSIPLVSTLLGHYLTLKSFYNKRYLGHPNEL